MSASAYDLLALLLVIAAIVRLYPAYRSTVRNHPPLEYEHHSSPVADAWRWRAPAPEIGLPVENSADSSRLLLPYRRVGFEIGASLFGYFFLSMFLYAIAVGSLEGHLDLPMLLFGCALFLPLTWALINTNSHIAAIELTRDAIRLELRYGVFLRRNLNVRRKRGLKFEGAYQSFFSMDRTQEVPDFKLILRRHCFFCLSARRDFYLLCDQSQGSWLVGGLNAWLALESAN